MADVDSPFLRNAPLPNSVFLSEGYPSSIFPSGIAESAAMPMLAAELLQSNRAMSDPGVVATQHLPACAPDDGRLQLLFGSQALSGSIPDTTLDVSHWTFRQQIDDIFARSVYHSRPEPSGITPVEPQSNAFLNIPAYQFGLAEAAPLVPFQSLNIYAVSIPSVNGWSGTAQYVPFQNTYTNSFAQADSYGWSRTAHYVGSQNSNPNPFTEPYSNGWSGAAPYQLQQDSSMNLPYSSGWTSASSSSLSDLPYWAQPDYAGPSFTARPLVNPQIGDTRPKPSAQPEVQSQPAQPEVRKKPARSHITFDPLPVKSKDDPEYPGVTSSEAARFDRIFGAVKRFFTGAKKRDALSMDPEEKACFNEINVIRGQHHLPPLTFSPTVKLVSDLQATEQANTHTMKHSNNNPQLSSHFQRLNLVKLGRDTMHDGENAAMGAQSGASVAHMWMGDAGHRRPILDRYLKIGSVSRALDSRGTPYWTFNASTGNEIA